MYHACTYFTRVRHVVHDLVPLITTVCMYRGLKWRVEHGLNMHAVAGHIQFDSSTYIASSRRHFALLAISLAFLLMVRTVWTLTFAVLNLRGLRMFAFLSARRVGVAIAKQ